MKAVRRFRCLRLSAVIYDIKHKDGIPVLKEQPFLRLFNVSAKYYIDPQWLKEHGYGRK